METSTNSRTTPWRLAGSDMTKLDAAECACTASRCRITQRCATVAGGAAKGEGAMHGALVPRSRLALAEHRAVRDDLTTVIQLGLVTGPARHEPVARQDSSPEPRISTCSPESADLTGQQGKPA
jgi:hypothetical protein